MRPKKGTKVEISVSAFFIDIQFIINPELCQYQYFICLTMSLKN